MDDERTVKTYTMDEVARHNKETDLWLVMHGGVYDLTNFVKKHPGGEEVFINSAGTDCTVCFDEIGHTKEAKLLKETFKIGNLVEDDESKNKIPPILESSQEKSEEPITKVNDDPIVDDDDDRKSIEPENKVNQKKHLIPLVASILVYMFLIYQLFF